MKLSNRRRSQRRGAIAVLAAIIMIVMVALVALAVDTGYMMVVRTQLQAASDAAAMAGASKLDQSYSTAIGEAQRFAGFHRVNGKPLVLAPEAVEIGEWDSESHQFTPTGLGNAVRINAVVNDGTLFFGKITGNQTFTTGTPSSAGISAVALAVPRDIVFVVDTSGRMNDDVELASNLGGFQAPDGTIGHYVLGNPLDLQLETRDWLQTVYQQLNWGTAPGSTEIIGQTLGVTDPTGAFESLVGDGTTPGLLEDATLPIAYRIDSEDDEAERREKCYKWLIEVQMPTLMPNVSPDLNNNFEYWAAYLDYLIKEESITSGSQTYHPYDMSEYANAQNARDLLANRIGYATYLQFLLDVGSDETIAGVNSLLSLENDDCPTHTESTDAGPYDFPPSVEPETTVRRTLINVIHYIDELNASMSSQNRDRVSIVAFSRSGPPQVILSLTDNYAEAKDAIASAIELHSKSDRGASSKAEAGLYEARQMLLPENEGGQGRQKATRVVFFVSGTTPDSIASSEAAILGQMNSVPDTNYYYSTEMLNRDGALAEAARMKLKRWKIKPAGLGLGIDEDFLTRMAQIHATITNSTGGSNGFVGHTPTEYQAALKNVLIGSIKRDVSLVE